MSPKNLVVLASALLLAGCSSQHSIWSQYFQVLRQSWRNSTEAGIITMEQAAAVPYASLAYRVDGGNEMMLVLATDTNGDQLWTASSHTVLFTRNGRILRSVGLRHDRGGMSTQLGEIPSPMQALKESFRSTRTLDFPDISRYGLQLNCVATARRREALIVLGIAITTTRVDEICKSRSPQWSFTDSYWIDQSSGFVWQSLQHLHPAGTIVQTKILRPPE